MRELLDGWKLLGVIVVVLGLAVAALLWRMPDVEGVRAAIRLTARTSLLLFLAAFTAAALSRLAPGPLTAWQRRNRRTLGLGFAASHGLHALAIVTFALAAPLEFGRATSTASFVFGGAAYAFIVAMAATSFDRTAAWIGPRAWKVLHTTGVYYLWFVFLISFGMRTPARPWYAVFVALLVAAMAARLYAARRGAALGSRA
ncbi:MAG: hypothetical protein JO035_04460 [Betaproteobacteria bacterium]|nr:hypothetical protein [Betaproteobacteria bacterium]